MSKKTLDVIFAAFSTAVWVCGALLVHKYYRPIDVDPLVGGTMMGMVYCIVLLGLRKEDK